MDQPEPILYLNHDLTSGGAEHALLALLKNLDRTRFCPTLWVKDRQGELLPQYEALNIEIRQVPGMMMEGPRRGLLWKLPANAWRLRRFSIVHSFCSNAWWTEPWSVRLAGVRGYVIRKSDHYRHGPRRSWDVRQNMADRIVCVTESIFNHFYRGSEYELKSRVIRNGVDSERYQPRPVSHELRTRFGLPPQASLFASVANLSPYKGQLPTLVALAWAKARNIPLYIVFAGRDLVRGEMQHWAAQLGVADRALFVGRVENIPDLHSQCDGMILLSRTEGCSNAVLEAMSCGAAVIVPDSGVEELIEHGCSGFCVPTGDMSECVRLMQQLHDRPELRSRVGQAARQRILQYFTLADMARRYEDLYAEILAPRSSRMRAPFRARSHSLAGSEANGGCRSDIARLPANNAVQTRL